MSEFQDIPQSKGIEKKWFFYSRPGAKPFVAYGFDAEEAKANLDETLQGSGYTSDDFIMKPESETLSYLRKNEPSEMQRGIVAAQEEAQKGEPYNPLFSAVRGILRMVAPFSAERGQNQQMPTAGSIAGDITSNALMLAQGPIGVPTREAVVTGLKELVASPMAKLGFASIGNDVAQQVGETGTVEPIRTGLVAGLQGVPIIGGKVARAMNDASPAILNNAFLPVKAQRESPNPPDWEEGLRQGLFGSMGRYSALPKVQAKLDRMNAFLDKNLKDAPNIDIEKVRKSAIDNVRSDNKLDAADKEAVLNLINSRFDKEAESHMLRYPEISHLEAIPNPSYEAEKGLFTGTINERKAQATRHAKELDKWQKEQEKRWAAGLQTDYESMPKYPQWMTEMYRTGLASFPEWVRTYETGAGKLVPNPRGLAYLDGNIPQEMTVGKVVERPEYFNPEWTAAKAQTLKHGAQEAIYDKNINTEKGAPRYFREKARGILSQMQETNPEGRAILSEEAKLYPIRKAMEYRKDIGGSNSLIPLKTLIGALGGGSLIGGGLGHAASGDEYGTSGMLGGAGLGLLLGGGLLHGSSSPFVAQRLYNNAPRIGLGSRLLPMIATRSLQSEGE